MSNIIGERWRIRGSLPEGGQAHTFKVSDVCGADNQLYVLKRLKNLQRLDRFRREMETIRDLKHENIVCLVDFDLDDSRPYIVTEFCSGGSLDNAQPFWRNAPGHAFEVFEQICAGLAYAHSRGVIHRDLKPANIFLRSQEGPAVVGDFGICFSDEQGQRITLTEEAVGARWYIAPELEDGRLDLISSKADIYSLGKILYWLFSNGKTFAREKHRDPQWDLKGIDADSPLGWRNIYLEHVNQLLDVMIVATPDDRCAVDNIRNLAGRAKRLIEKRIYADRSRDASAMHVLWSRLLRFAGDKS
jgi:serine/threonine protein kinase